MYISRIAMHDFASQPSQMQLLLRSIKQIRLSRVGLLYQAKDPWQNVFHIFKLVLSHFLILNTKYIKMFLFPIEMSYILGNSNLIYGIKLKNFLI